MRDQANKSTGEVVSHQTQMVAYRKHKLTARHLKPAKQRARANKPVVVRSKKITLACIVSVQEGFAPPASDYACGAKFTMAAPLLRHLAPNGQINPDITKEFIKVAQRFKPLNDHLQMNLEDTMSQKPETLLPLPPAKPSTQGKSSTLHRRAYLAEEGLLRPLTAKEKAQIAESLINAREGLQRNY